MKVLVVYNSLDPQSVAGAMMARLRYNDVTLKDIRAITTGNITTWIGTLSAIYNLILICYTVTTAGTGVISPAQQVLLDAKIDRTSVQTGTATSIASDNTLTDAGSGWVVNAYAGMYVKTTGGTGPNQVRQIVSNTSQVLTLDSVWTAAIGVDTTFIICATRNEFSHALFTTSGNKKQALVMWEDPLFFYGTYEPLIIFNLAGDKTTASTEVNAQSVLNEYYAIRACKYFLRDLTDQTVVANWKKLLCNDKTRLEYGAMQTYQDVVYHTELMKYGKLLYDSKTAFSES